MSTEFLFRADSYLRQTTAQVIGLTENGGIILDRTVFYPTGGGQPGDPCAQDTDALAHRPMPRLVRAVPCATMARWPALRSASRRAWRETSVAKIG